MTGTKRVVAGAGAGAAVVVAAKAAAALAAASARGANDCFAFRLNDPEAVRRAVTFDCNEATWMRQRA